MTIMLRTAFFAAVVLSQLMPASSADHQQVLTAIKMRRASIGLLRCTLRTVESQRMTAVANELEDERISKKVEELISEATSDYTIDLERGRFRLEFRGPILNFNTGTTEPRHKVTMFDGERGHILQLLQSENGKVIDLSELTRRGPAIQTFAEGPLFWMLGVFTSPDFLNADRETPLTGPEWKWETSTEGLPILVRKGTRLLSRFYFDPEYGLNVVRMESTFLTEDMGRPIGAMVTEYDVTYSRTANEWVPQSWSLIHHKQTQKSVEVIDWESVASFPEDLFQPPKDFLQPGMAVGKPGESIKVVASNGALITPRNHHQTESGSWSVGARVILVAAAFAALVYWQRRRHPA